MTHSGFRLSFGDKQAIVQHSEAEFLDHLQRTRRPITDAAFTTRTGQFSRTNSIRIGGLIVGAVQSSPVKVDTCSEPQQTLVLLTTGQGRAFEGTKEHRISAGNTILRSSYHNPLHIDYEQISGVTIRPDLDMLAAEIEARRPATTGIRERLITTGTDVFTGTLGGKDYRDTLLQLIAMIDRSGCDAAFLSRIGFEDIVTRHIAEILCEYDGYDLRVAKRTLTPGDAERAIAAICDHIRANIGRPLTISRMVRMTGLSSDALDEAFRSRFQCTPQQWQRNVLLDEARKLLTSWMAEPVIKGIAYDLGFSSASSFAYHYRKRFGEPPSTTAQGRIRH